MTLHDWQPTGIYLVAVACAYGVLNANYFEQKERYKKAAREFHGATGRMPNGARETFWEEGVGYVGHWQDGEIVTDRRMTWLEEHWATLLVGGIFLAIVVGVSSLSSAMLHAMDVQILDWVGKWLLIAMCLYVTFKILAGFELRLTRIHEELIRLRQDVRALSRNTPFDDES